MDNTAGGDVPLFSAVGGLPKATSWRSALRELSSYKERLAPRTDTFRADVHMGEALTILRGMESSRYDCCVTSPPYYFVRDYGHDEQLGLEQTPEEYVTRLLAICAEVMRVLRPSGTFWLNVDDSYCTRRAVRPDGKRTVARGGALPTWRESRERGLTISSHDFDGTRHREKSLFGVTAMLMIALQEQGWIVRNRILWTKNVVVPERKADRCANSYEEVFLLVKQTRGYTWNSEVAVEPASGGGTRPLRDVWDIRPALLREDDGVAEHTAAMPISLAARCILLGSPDGGRVLDPFGGTGTTACAAKLFGRHADIIELNPEYAEAARRRIASVPLDPGNTGSGQPDFMTMFYPEQG